MIGAVTILALNYLVVEVSFRFKFFRRVMAGEPTLLVHNGKVFKDRMVRERINMEDLEAALRKSGVGAVDKVRYAVLEENGQISVIPRGQ
jgi:uncharacterized membrane protein YcaP (DUF421 family)